MLSDVGIIYTGNSTGIIVAVAVFFLSSFFLLPFFLSFFQSQSQSIKQNGGVICKR
jgi:hypothetical protein